MSLCDVPEERILVFCLDTISKQTEIIDKLVSSTRRLRDSLDIAVKELQRLRAKEKLESDRTIA